MIFLDRLCVLSRVWLFASPWTVTRQTSLSMGFPRQEYWSGLPFSSPEDLPDPGIKLTSPAAPVLAGGFFTTSATWEVPVVVQFSSVQSLSRV